MLARNLEQTLHRALSLASERRHEYATLEHLLLGLADDSDAATVLRACGVDLDRLRADLGEYLDKDLAGLVTDRPGDPKPTAGFQRVVQRAAIHVQSSGRDEVTGANILASLFSERESSAVYFLQRQDMTRLDVVNFMSHGIIKNYRPSAAVEPPPVLPTQGVGPHVEIDSEGVVGFSPPDTLDADGNHLPRLRALHPELCELARELVAALAKRNAPHYVVLCERVTAYAALIDRDLQEVDFRRLYATGVRLSNAAYATEQFIAGGDFLPLDLGAREKLDSLLALHGSLILSTTAGTEALLDEERYRRRPAEERQFRADAVVLADALQNHPDLIAPDVAEQVLGAAQEIGEGRNPERSTVAGHATLRNVMISVAGGAIGSVAFDHALLVASGVGAITTYIGLLALNESVKKQKWFQQLTGSSAATADTIIDAQSKVAMERLRSGLRRQRNFIMNNKSAVSKFAGDDKKLEFLDLAIRWLDAQVSHLPPDDKKG